MRRQRVVLVGYGREVEFHRDGTAWWYAFRGVLHATAREYAALPQWRGEEQAVYVLSERHGLVAPPFRLVSRPLGARVQEQPAAAQRRWAAGVVAQLLLAHGGACLEVEIHDWEPHGVLLRQLLPAAWRASECVPRGTISQRLAWYREQLDAAAALRAREGGA